jgi:peptidyl-prolyl cis-trans isomerase A (cyclophilin A)
MHRTTLHRLAGAIAVSAVSLCLALPAWAQKVKLDTSMGEIVLELDAEKAPKTVANFLQYVKAGHYNGTIFHRVIDGFMVQGGGFTPEMSEKGTRAPIALEAGNGLSNVRGALAMARTSVPDSATAQFFINVVDNPRLDTHGGGYAVFGKVVQGMEVVDRIKNVATGQRAGMANVPQQAIVIRKAALQ